MRKEREALLIAALAGLVVVGAAAMVVQPTLAGKLPDTRIIPTQSAALQSSPLAVSHIG